MDGLHLSVGPGGKGTKRRIEVLVTWVGWEGGGGGGVDPSHLSPTTNTYSTRMINLTVPLPTGIMRGKSFKLGEDKDSLTF
jgi:hypothetical protein